MLSKKLTLILTDKNVYLGARRYYKGTEGALPGLAKLGDEAEVKGLNYPTPEILIRQKTGKSISYWLRRHTDC